MSLRSTLTLAALAALTSTQALAQVAGTPSAPTSVVYYPSTNTLAWSSPAQFGTGAFTAYQATANGVQIANAVVWSATSNAPAAGKVVVFEVRACNTLGCGPAATTSYASPGAAAGSPSAPSAILYNPDTLSWASPNSFGTGAFTEYRATANGNLIANGGIFSTIFAKPAAGQTVAFEVRACNTNGCGLGVQLSYTTPAAAVAPSAPSSIVYSPSSNTLSWSSPANFGNGTFTAYQATANGVQIANAVVWSATYAAPPPGQTVNFTARACSTAGCGPTANLSYTSPGGPPPVTSGLVIPAYYQLTDTTKWSELATAAGQLTAANNASIRDFWVVANYANGPFTSTQWADAAPKFNSIRTNGGKIFGYVYTHQAAYTAGANLVQKAAFRTLATVKADITAWVTGYPNLDGIWIDEYYPRHELATEAGTLPSGAAYDGRYANHPNGLTAAPPAYRTAGLDLYATGQIEPAGGWYAELFTWIRATYPNLRIIGNAGGQFYSNQMKYGAIVDLLVSFEQTQAYGSANNWQELRRNDPAFAGSKQLALIHSVTNVTNMQTVIAKAKAAGFSHFFATDAVYNVNLWSTNSSYLAQQVTAILAP